MYKIENGILRKDGKKVFALGQSYYPSFHHAKYPVPPEGDRMGEMTKDLKMMHDMGFNHVRFAGLGKTELSPDGKVQVDTPFVDAMISEADKNEISVSIRLQGYVINLRGHKDVLMVDENGNLQDTKRWFDFIQTTLHHPGMLEDNAMATQALVRHFETQDGVVAFQIYNEPHYPGPGRFDYHPMAIEAYRKHLTQKGILSEEEAASYEPPRNRKDQTPQMWALWRLFARDSLTKFLNDSSYAAKTVSDLPTYTCFTTCQLGAANAFRGVDMYGTAEGMDVIGYTCYFSAQGMDYYPMCLVMDMNTCAAWLKGKQAWCVEMDSRTKIPLNIFNQNTYACIGTGVKGIVYYQWRGDYPSEATPIPNGCGLVNFDGSKTANFDNAANMVKLLNNLSDTLVEAERIHQGIGLLHSDYAAFYADGVENSDESLNNTNRNSWITRLTTIYTDLRKQGMTVDVIDPEGLKTHMESIKILFVPCREYLSDQEDALVKAFIAKGGVAYEIAARKKHIMGMGQQGYNLYGKAEAVYELYQQIEDIVALHGLTPVAQSTNPLVPVQVLQGKDCKILCLTNISCPHRAQKTTLMLNFQAKNATFYHSLGQPERLPVQNRQICIPDVGDGGILIVEE